MESARQDAASDRTRSRFVVGNFLSIAQTIESELQSAAEAQNPNDEHQINQREISGY
jgi:hypothetical protein